MGQTSGQIRSEIGTNLVLVEFTWMKIPAVPEFGQVTTLILAVAIVSIIAVSAKTGLRFLPKVCPNLDPKHTENLSWNGFSNIYP